MIESLNKKERRNNQRVTADVRCWLERESLTLLGTVTNISSGGLFLRTPVNVDKGCEVDLTVNLGSGVVEAKGNVAWTTSPESSPRGAGIGIRFVDVSGGESLLSRYVTNRSSDSE